MKENTNKIGLCPICNSQAEITDLMNDKPVKEMLCSNEFYKHFISGDIDYIYKRKNVKHHDFK